MDKALVARWESRVIWTGAVVLAVAVLAWVFPREAAASVGSMTLPALAILGLVLALVLASEWPWLLGLVGVLGVTLLLGWNHASDTSTSHFSGACLGVLAMVLIGRSVRTPAHMRLAVALFLGGGLVMLCLGLAGAPVRLGSVVDAALPMAMPPVRLGLSGLQDGIVNPNALAAAVLLVAPMGLAVLVFGTRARRDRWVLYPMSAAVVGVGGVVLAISDSRTAWVAIWITLVGLLVSRSGSVWVRVIMGTVVAAPVVLVINMAFVLDQETVRRTTDDVWRSAQDRAYILGQGIEHLRQSPFLGIGVNEFRTVFRPNPSAAAHAHNMALQTALDVGIVGSAAYWAIMGLLINYARGVARGTSGLARSVALGGALSLVLVSLFGLTDAVSLGARIGLFQWMAGGLILAAHHIREEM